MDGQVMEQIKQTVNCEVQAVGFSFTFLPPPPTFKIFHKFHNKVGKNIGCMAFTMWMLILTTTKLTWQKKPHQKIKWCHTRSNLILKTVHSDVTLQISPQLMFFPQMAVMLASLRDRRLGYRLGNYYVQLSWKDEHLNCWQKAHQSKFFKCQKAI